LLKGQLAKVTERSAENLTKTLKDVLNKKLRLRKIK
jgi:hypothetical protein